MDSLSQIVLGAGVAEATLGKKIGNKSLLWGAVFGTIPDLDIISNYWLDDFIALSVHRGFSHSLVFCLLLSPLFGWIINRLYARKNEANFKDWTKMIFWVFLTHILLDCLTSWGTQVFWPHPVRISTNSIFVADLLYTIPFLGFVIWTLFYKRDLPKRRKINRVGLIISTSYLALGLFIKVFVNDAFNSAYEEQNHQVLQWESRPMPLNLLLWTANAELDDGYLMGYYSILDDDNDIDFTYVPKHHELLSDYEDDELVQIVKHVTNGWYSVLETDSCIVVNDLRFGQPEGWNSDPDEFVFKYLLFEENGRIVNVDPVDPPRPNWEEMKPVLGEIYRRAMGNKP